MTNKQAISALSEKIEELSIKIREQENALGQAVQDKAAYIKLRSQWEEELREQESPKNSKDIEISPANSSTISLRTNGSVEEQIIRHLNHSTSSMRVSELADLIGKADRMIRIAVSSTIKKLYGEGQIEQVVEYMPNWMRRERDNQYKIKTN